MRSRTTIDKVALIMAVDHFVTGTARTCLLRRDASVETGVSDEDFWAAQEPVLSEAMASGRYPEVARLPEDVFTIGGTKALEFGLRPLARRAGGLHRQQACRAAGRGPTRHKAFR